MCSSVGIYVQKVSYLLRACVPRLSCLIRLLITYMLAALDFCPGLFRKSCDGGDERGDILSPLQTRTCHRGPLGVCWLPQVVASGLLNPLPF